MEPITVYFPVTQTDKYETLHPVMERCLTAIAQAVRCYGTVVTPDMVAKWTGLAQQAGLNADCVKWAAREWAHNQKEFPSFSEFKALALRRKAEIELDMRRDHYAKALPDRVDAPISQEARKKAREAARARMKPEARAFFDSVVGEPDEHSPIVPAKYEATPDQVREQARRMANGS